MSAADKQMTSSDAESDVSQAIQRKVNMVLQNTRHLNRRHHAFIVNVLDQCEQGIQALQSAHRPSQKIRASKSSRTPRRSTSRTEYSSMMDYELQAKNLATEIKEHFSQMVEEITNHLHRTPDSDRSEIWASYESSFFLCVMREMIALYVFAYEGDAKLLQMLLPSANPRSMKLRGEWIVDILDPTHNDANDDTLVSRTAEMATQTDPTSDDEIGRAPGTKATLSPIKLQTAKVTGQGVHSRDKKRAPKDNVIVESLGVKRDARSSFNASEAQRKVVSDATATHTNAGDQKQLAPIDVELQDSIPGQDMPEASNPGMFSQAYFLFGMVLKESLPLVKLQWLVKCLREISDHVKSQVSLALNGKTKSIGTDELLPSVILFLIKGDPGKITAFYPHLKFLIDYLPDFIASGEIGFTLMQFSIAYMYIIKTDDGE